MSVRIMIIDGQADFRSLLMHHVTTCWHDAIISAYDPIQAGHLPEEFSGAGNDMILIGSEQGDRDPLKTLGQFRRIAGFPPIVYFGKGGADERRRVRRLKLEGYFRRDEISHQALSVRLSDVLRTRRRLTSTDSLFVGDLRTGARPIIRGYRLIRKLAASEYSAVYLAERESTRVQVALKVMRQVPDLSEGLGAFDRFLQEYELIAGLKHPGVVKIRDLGIGDDHAHIAMEYLPGGNLRDRIARGVSEADAVSYVSQIAAALAEIHRLGILHRDLKPGNIMFRDDNSLAIIDFGLAKRQRLEAEITGGGTIFGTPYYMSPEQGHAGEIDARSDLYSLGVIFFELLTGEKPFRGENAMAIIYKHGHEPLPDLPESVARYRPLVHRLLAKSPQDRPASADDVVAELQALAA